MTNDEHLAFLESLKKMCEDAGSFAVAPKVEGAFYFGYGIGLKEYTNLYEKSCIEHGIIK